MGEAPISCASCIQHPVAPRFSIVFEFEAVTISNRHIRIFDLPLHGPAVHRHALVVSPCSQPHHNTLYNRSILSD